MPNEEQAKAIQMHSDKAGSEDNEPEDDDRVAIALPTMSLPKDLLKRETFKRCVSDDTEHLKSHCAVSKIAALFKWSCMWP